MKLIRTPHRILTVFFLSLMFFFIAQTFSFAAKDKKKGSVMTEVELQSELMSYADRFASIITQAFEDYETSKPFDIKEYQDTIAEVTTLVETTNQLVGTVGLEKLLPELVKAVDQVGNEGEELIDHSFRQGVLLILIAMGAYVVARLIYNFLNQKIINPS